MVRTIAACLALTAFAVAVAAGLMAHNTADVVLGRALLAMVLGKGLGLVIGLVGTRVVEDQLRAYVSSNPHGSRREVSTGSPPVEKNERVAA